MFDVWVYVFIEKEKGVIIVIKFLFSSFFFHYIWNYFNPLSFLEQA